jgi:hypothetical protein
MLYRALIFAIFILVSWLGFAYAQIKGLNTRMNYQLITLQQQMNTLQQQIAKNQGELQQQLEKIAARKAGGTQKEKPKKKAKLNVKKKTATEIISGFSKKLAIIDRYQKKNDLVNAAKLLAAFKKEVWKVRKHNELNKKVVLSMLSPIDLALKKWKEKKKDYTIKRIKQKLKKLKK